MDAYPLRAGKGGVWGVVLGVGVQARGSYTAFEIRQQPWMRSMSTGSEWASISARQTRGRERCSAGLRVGLADVQV